jgi:STE24 endopeptidase
MHQPLPPDNSETESIQTELDEERQRLASEYGAIRRRLFFVDLGIIVAWAVLLLVAGWSIALREWAESISNNPWIVVALYAVALGVAYILITFPINFYAGFVVPHRYRLSTQSFGGWLLDNLKELALGGVIGLAGLELLYWLLRTFPEWWWVLMAGLMWLFGVAMAQLAPVLIMPLFYKFRPLDEPELVSRLTVLAEKAGTKVRGVYVMDMSSRTTEANAMLTGLGRTRRIILGDTLLKGYTHDEIETVLAHELAHHVHNDLPKGLVAQAVIITAGMWLASVVLTWGVGVFGFRGIDDVAALPLFLVSMLIFGLVTMPATNFLYRRMERAADSYALSTTGKALAFRSVMMKLAGQNLAEAEPPAWVRLLFHGHPSIAERIEFANAYATSGKTPRET